MKYDQSSISMHMEVDDIRVVDSERCLETLLNPKEEESVVSDDQFREMTHRMYKECGRWGRGIKWELSNKKASSGQFQNYIVYGLCGFHL